MLDGLHWKLLGYGLVGFPRPVMQFADVRRVLPVGKPASEPVPKTFADPGGIFTPLLSTVIPAPSYAPISDGSCSSSARLPLTVVSQPTTPSSGTRSTCGLLGPPEK